MLTLGVYNFFRALNSVAIGIVVFVFFSVYSGLVIYAKYHDCDPVQTKVNPAKMCININSCF